MTLRPMKRTKMDRRSRFFGRSEMREAVRITFDMGHRAGADVHLRRERQRGGLERGRGADVQQPEPDGVHHGAGRHG